MEKPEKLHKFMNMVMKEARRNSLIGLLESWGITEEEYEEIRKWFISQGVSI